MTTTTLSPENESLPARVLALPEWQGQRVPWYATRDIPEPGGAASPVPLWDAQGRDFAVSRLQVNDALQRFLCPVCGTKLGRYVAFTLSVEEVLRGMTSMGPAHVDCARWRASWLAREINSAEEGESADEVEREVASDVRALWEVESGARSYRIATSEDARLVWVEIFPGESLAKVSWHGPEGFSRRELQAAAMAVASGMDEEAAAMGMPESSRGGVRKALERRIERVLGEWGDIVALPSEAEV